MSRAGVGLLVAVLALAGCKSTNSKSGDDKPSAGVAGRTKKDSKNKDKDKDNEATPAKGPAWLDDVAKLPGAGTSVPKSGSPADPRDPNFDAKAAAQDAIGGRVLDPNGKPARNVFVRIDPVGTAPGGPAAMGIYTDGGGYFFTRGLKAGKTYDLTAEAAQDGKTLTGVVQTKVPNPILLIVLRDDLPAIGGGLPPPKGPPGTDGGTFPPPPKPSDKVGEYIPTRPTPKAAGDNAWSPGGGVVGTPPATIGAKPTPGGSGAGAPIPPPDFSEPVGPGSKPEKPENVADGPKDPYKSPPASIPGPGGPPVPKLPPPPPPFDPTGKGRSSMGAPGTTTASGKIALVDTLERPWGLDSVKPGSLVLVEFMTSTCGPCKQAIPILKDLQSRYGASGLQLAGVMCDDQPQKDRVVTAAKYTRDHNLNYAVYVEQGDAGSVRDRFNVESYPTAILMDSAGRVLWKGHPGKRVELESAIKQYLGK
jgi:thiol-disulfide isomerase/thioredoxin